LVDGSDAHTRLAADSELSNCVATERFCLRDPAVPHSRLARITDLDPLTKKTITGLARDAHLTS
jgi:hypothetical protein